MDVEIFRTEVMQFLLWEYINLNFFAVCHVLFTPWAPQNLRYFYMFGHDSNFGLTLNSKYLANFAKNFEMAVLRLVGFGRACAPVRCAHPSFWAK
jgi:hypothetical protein